MMNSKSPFSESPAGADAVTHLVLTVFRLNGMLLNWGDQLVAPLGLTSARWQMLGAIALAGQPLTAPQIGEAMGVTRQGAQKQLNLLLELGLVQALPNPAHRRSPLYGLSPQGVAIYGKADTLWNGQANRIGETLRASDAAAATRALEALMAALQSTPIHDKEKP